jgi:hypothetical protein
VVRRHLASEAAEEVTEAVEALQLNLKLSAGDSSEETLAEALSDPAAGLLGHVDQQGLEPDAVDVPQRILTGGQSGA